MEAKTCSLPRLWRQPMSLISHTFAIQVRMRRCRPVAKNRRAVFHRNVLRSILPECRSLFDNRKAFSRQLALPRRCRHLWLRSPCAPFVRELVDDAFCRARAHVGPNNPMILARAAWQRSLASREIEIQGVPKRCIFGLENRLRAQVQKDARRVDWRIGSVFPTSHYAGFVPLGMSRRRTTSQARPTFSISQMR